MGVLAGLRISLKVKTVLQEGTADGFDAVTSSTAYESARSKGLYPTISRQTAFKFP